MVESDDLASFDPEPLQAALRDLEGLADGFGRAMTNAFRRAVVDGKKLEDVLRGLALGLSNRALSAALAPIGNGIGSLFSGLFGGNAFARGGVIGAGGLRRFAEGGVVGGPTAFPMRGGLGLMGEAGAEAILPLARGPDGNLGVRAAGRAPVSVTFNVTARDAESFRRAEGELTAMLARAVSRGQRGL